MAANAIKNIFRSLMTFVRYFVFARDMSLEISMTEGVFAEHFKEYLKVMGVETEYSQKKQVYLSRNNSCSIVRNIINAIPATFEWNVHSIDAKHSKLDIKFAVPFYLKIKLYACLIVVAFIQFGVLPWFHQNITDSDIFYTAIYKAVSHFLIVLSLFIFCFILMLLDRYRKYLLDLAIDIAYSLKNVPPNFIPFSKSPHRLIEDFKLFTLALLVTLLPAIKEADFQFSAPQVFLIIILCLVVLYSLCLIIGGMKGSLQFTRSSALTSNFTIAIITMATLVLIPQMLYKISKQHHNLDVSIQAEHNVNIIQMLSVPENYPQDAVASTQDCVKAEFVLIVAFEVIVFMIMSMVLYTIAYGKDPKLLANANNRYIRNIFRKNSAIRDNKLALSSDMKTSVYKNFILLSTAIWIVLLLNIPIVTAFVFPDITKLHIGYGKVIYSGVHGITNALMIGRDFRYKQYLPMVMVSPLLLVFFSFVLSNIYYALKASLQHLFMQKVEGETQSMVDRMANEIGVRKVYCLRDRRKKSWSHSPRAVISDIRQRNIIVFTKNSIQFMEKYPNYAEAIIAHEIAHLKLHCAEIRENTIKSRYGFVGSTFLSLLYDSITMEDEADKEAKKYLVSHNMDENLVQEAAWTIGRQKNGISCDIEQVNFAALAPANKRTFRKTLFIVDFILATDRAYEIYFGSKPYDYIHRDARYR